MRLNVLAKVMRTAGDQNRLKIMCALFDRKEACVSEIAQNVGLTVATASHHLRVMAKEELLVSVRRGKKICYGLPKGPFVRDLKKFICKYK